VAISFNTEKNDLEEMTFLEIMLVTFPSIFQLSPASSSTCRVPAGALSNAKLDNIRTLVQLLKHRCDTFIGTEKMMLFLQKTSFFQDCKCVHSLLLDQLQNTSRATLLPNRQIYATRRGHQTRSSVRVIH